MIEVGVSWFLFLYLLCFLGGIFAAWWGFEAYRRRVGKRWRQSAWRCPQCGMIFQPSEPRPVCQCPRCGGGVENPGHLPGMGAGAFSELD
jgi:hypothetical protein